MASTRKPAVQRWISLAALLASVTLRPGSALADNPIVQTNYTADPAPMLHEGRLYLYTSHDEDVTVNDFFTMNDWRLYSTVDMVNWTDHGSPASYRTLSWGTGDAWAPQAVARNGQFYLYVPVNNSTGSKIGVLVADNPSGPFTDALGSPLISTGSGNIDPTVFIDDDEQAYLYWGNPNLWYVKLNSDMISFQGNPTQINLTAEGFGQRSGGSGSAYQEGPWFYGRDSLYYLVFAADGVPEKLSHSTSTSPLGPWTFAGDIMAKQNGSGSSFTNHPGVIDYKGKSYFFYHNGALPGGGGYKRSVCVEEFTYGADGKIPTVQMSQQGPDPVDTLNPFEQVEAETIAFSSGLKTEKCMDTGDGMNVTSISNGDYIKVKNVDFLDGVTSFEARVSSAAGNAGIELRLDSQTGTLLGTCDVSGASSWTTQTCPVSGGSGTHDLFLKFTGGSGDLLKFNWWKFDGPNEGGGAGGMGGTAGLGGTGGGSAGATSGGGGLGDSGASGNGGTASGGTAGGAGSGGAGAAAGGAGGTGGVQATDGTVATAGVGPSTSGRGGSGAAGTGTAGGGQSSVAGGAGPDTTGDDASDSSTSCACRTGSRTSDVPAGAAWLLLALTLLRRSPLTRRVAASIRPAKPQRTS